MPNWAEILKEIQTLEQQIRQVQHPVDTIRHRYLSSLHSHTKRNVISYYSGFLSKPGVEQSEINDEDKDGFMMAIHHLDRSIGLDLILHTPGGDIAATESIVDYLHRMFGKDIRAIVPQIAMSAGTVIACSCKEIVMSKHSNLGPIDPHLRGVPALGVIEEFKRACNEIKGDPAKIPMWQCIIQKYHPTFLSQCENAIKWSKQFVGAQLRTVMFDGSTTANKRAIQIVKKLTDYSGNKNHGRHIHIDECKKIGLKVLSLEDDNEFQDLVLTVHHCYMHLLQNTPAYKIIENHAGIGMVKNVAMKQ